MLDWDRVDALMRCKVLENYRHIEVFDSEKNALKHHTFNIIDIHHKEWEFTDRYKAIPSRSYLHDLLLRASEE